MINLTAELAFQWRAVGRKARLLQAANSGAALCNLRLVPSVAGNALTMAVKTISGDDPSNNDPVLVAFRDPNLISGAPEFLEVTAPLSLTIASGKSFSTSAVAFRLWWVMFNDASVMRLGVMANTSNFFLLDEYGLRSATDMTGAFTFVPGRIYSDVTITSKPYRILGYTEWTSGLSTATLWDAVPNVVQQFGPGVKKPGDLVLTSRNTVAISLFGGTPNIPYDGTPPQATEGSSSISVTPGFSSPANFFECECRMNLARNPAGVLIAALFSNLSSNPIDIVTGWALADQIIPLRLKGAGLCYGITSLFLRHGGTGGASVSMNADTSGTSPFGFGWEVTELVVKEYMG
jgi:hypothetical protein